MSIPKKGEKAPAFSGPDQDGNVVSLSDFKGRKLILFFYPKDDTPGCTAEACSLRDKRTILLKEGYEVLGVSPDTVQKHRKFVDKYDLPFRLLADPDLATIKAYGVWGPKTARGLCAWRELTGRAGSRRAPRVSELRAVTATARLRVSRAMVTGLNVSRTCQTMTWVTGSGKRVRVVRAVFPVSTGKAATKTRKGSFRVFRRQDRWANSQEFPSSRPNMYRPVYFSGGQAFHGMQQDRWVYDWPASHGCVRMLRKDVDRLWKAGATAVGTRFRVYGDW